MRGVASLTIALLVGACGTIVDVDSAVRRHGAARSCCVDAQELTRHAHPDDDLGRSQAIRFSLEEDRPAFAFPRSGLSRFRVFKLPETNASYTVTLRSYLFGAGTGRPPKSSAFFYPKMTLLDANGNVVGDTDQEALRYSLSTFSDEPNETNRLDASFAVRPEHGARYLVVHTFADRVGSPATYVGRSARLTVPVGSGIVSMPVGDGSYPVIGSPIAPADMLRLTVTRTPAGGASKS